MILVMAAAMASDVDAHSKPGSVQAASMISAHAAARPIRNAKMERRSRAKGCGSAWTGWL